MLLRTFGGAFGVTAIGLVLAFVYGGPTGMAAVAILAVLEISLSFDNAVVNATVLGRMSAACQRLFLTIGVVIAVVGMRLLFPVLIVCVTAKMSPAQAFHLALASGGGSTGYAAALRAAHPAIAAFGGVFLLMLFLNYIFSEREITWLSWLERPLAKAGRLKQLSVVVAGGALLLAANFLAPAGQPISVMVSGALGLIVYVLVDGLGDLFAGNEGAGDAVRVAGRAAFFIFVYLEVLDATFSFDGVIGAFAITSDPVVIAIGLGIGATYIRSLTVFLVRQGTLNEYAYLEHGAQWAIGALAVLLLCTIRYQIPEIVTGLIGVGFIGTALLSSIVHNRRASRPGHQESDAPWLSTTASARPAPPAH